MCGDRGRDVPLLGGQDLLHGAGFGLSARRELLDGVTGVLRATGLQVGQELLDILRGTGLELLLHRGRHRTPRRPDERLLQQGERAGFGLAGIGCERPLPHLRVGPARRDRDEFFVQPGGARTIQTQATEQDHARDGIGRLRQAGA